MTLLHDQSLFYQRSTDQPSDHPDAPDASNDAYGDTDHGYGVDLSDAPWDGGAASLSSQTNPKPGADMAHETHETDDPDETNEAALIAAFLAACRIPPSGPQMGVSLKNYVLLFDEYYTDLYSMTEAER